MKTEKLKTGDLVKLKSGSPLMTVFSDKEYDFITNGFSYQYKEDLVICAWFDEHGLCYKYVFHTQALKKMHPSTI